MPKPVIRVHDIETDEVVDREMTDSEYADYQLMLEADRLEQTEVDSKQAQKSALLDRLGITADEAKLLLA